VLTYVITEQDFKNPPYPSIIQTVWQAPDGLKIKKVVEGKLKEYIKEYKIHRMTLEELNDKVLLDIEDLKVEYPEAFPSNTLGYYSKNVLAELYLNGRCVIDNKSSAQLIREKEDRIQFLKSERLEIERLEIERKLEEGRKAEEARVVVVKGMKFKKKYDLFRAYQDVLPSNVTVNTFKEVLEEFIGVRYVGGSWLVEEIRKEGGRAWEGGWK